MSDIERVKSNLDIATVIGQYVQLKNAGSNLKGLCPFHQEKTPSFMVNPSLQIFKCFGCGRAGDVIKFIQEYDRVDFPEALKMAAERAGVQLTNKGFDQDQKIKEKKERIIEANTLAAKFYQYILKTHASGKAGRDYAQKRQIGAKEIEKFMFGYAPKGYYNLKRFLTQKGFDEKELVEFGLLINRNNDTIDKFRERLLQPVRDVRGNIVGFSGRYFGTNESSPKYLNSPETFVFKKQDLLYGIYEGAKSIKQENFVILVEGNIDVVSSHRIGVENIVAPLGTAFTSGQARIIKRYADLVYLCFDTDAAGLGALIRSIEILENEGIKHKVIDLKEFHDADDLVCKEPNAWEKRIKEAIHSVEYLIRKFSAEEDLGSVEGKVRFRNRILPIIRSLKDEVEMSHFAKEISLILEITVDDFMKEIKNIRSTPRRNVVNKTEQDEIIAEGTEKPAQALLPIEKFLMALVFQNKSTWDLDINKEDFFNEQVQNLFEKAQKTAFDFNSEAVNELENHEREILEDILLEDTSFITDPAKEAEKILKKVRKENTLRKIMSIRSKMSREGEKEELLIELAKLGEDLKN